MIAYLLSRRGRAHFPPRVPANMRRAIRLGLATAALGALPASGGAQSAPTATPQAGNRAVVDATGARFAFPLPQQSDWQWAWPGTPIGQLEYGWAAEIDNAGKRF